MVMRILFNKIYTDINDELTLDSKTGKIRNIENDLIFQIPGKERPPHYYFSLSFNSYIQKSIYDPIKITKIILVKLYYIELHIKNIIDTPLGIDLKDYFIMLQKNNIYGKLTYDIPINELRKHIRENETSYNYLIPLHIYIINKDYAYNFDKKSIMTTSKMAFTGFYRNGGILETNNPKKIIQDNFIKKCNKTLVIIPKNMTNLWDNTDVHIITFDAFLKLKKNNLQLIINKSWNRIIIHECHIQFIIGIFNLLKKIKCDTLWIINTLPLTYYFSNITTPEKLYIIDICKYLKLWINNINFKNNKLTISKFIFTRLNSIYKRVTYESNTIDKIININLNGFETHIINEFKKYYDNWKNKLTYDINNSYSFTSNKQITSLNHKFFNAITTLSLAVIDKEHISNFMTNKIKDNITTITTKQNLYDNILSNHTKNYNGHFHTFNEFHKYKTFLEIIKKNKNKNITKIENYKRYLLNDKPYMVHDQCPICYEPFIDTNIIQTILVCNHSVCMECMIHAMTNNNECPICREHITVNELVIVKNTINNYSSELVNLCTTMEPNTIILTEFTAFKNIIYWSDLVDKNNIISKIFIINDKYIMEQIKKISIVSNILLILSDKIPNNIHIDNIIGYFNSFNIRPTITQINVCY